MLTDEQCIDKLSKYYDNYRLDREEEIFLKIDYYDGCTWGFKDYDFFRGVSNIEKISEAYWDGTHLKVVYKNGRSLLYKDIHGTWGFPTYVR